MSNVQPAAYLDITASEDSLVLPLTGLPGLDSAAIDPQNGDIRKILYSQLKKVYAGLNAIPTADRPARLNITRFTTVSGNTIQQAYTLTFEINIDEADIASEPVTSQAPQQALQ